MQTSNMAVRWQGLITLNPVYELWKGYCLVKLHVSIRTQSELHAVYDKHVSAPHPKEFAILVCPYWPDQHPHVLILLKAISRKHLHSLHSITCSFTLIDWLKCRVSAVGLMPKYSSSKWQKKAKCTTCHVVSILMWYARSESECPPHFWCFTVLLPGPDWLISLITASPLPWPAAVSKTQQASVFEPTLDSSVWHKGDWDGPTISISVLITANVATHSSHTHSNAELSDSSDTLWNYRT